MHRGSWVRDSWKDINGCSTCKCAVCPQYYREIFIRIGLLPWASRHPEPYIEHFLESQLRQSLHLRGWQLVGLALVSPTHYRLKSQPEFGLIEGETWRQTTSELNSFLPGRIGHLQEMPTGSVGPLANLHRWLKLPIWLLALHVDLCVWISRIPNPQVR